MIWFACRNCGRKLSRPDNSAGSMIFCDCGQSLTVPWESTIDEPEMTAPVDQPPLPPAPEWGAAPPPMPGVPPLPPAAGRGPAAPPPPMPAPFDWAPGQAPPAPRRGPAAPPGAPWPGWGSGGAPPAWGPGGVPPQPLMGAVPVGEEQLPVPPRRPPPPGGPPYPQQRRMAITPRDRNFCFNHQQLPAERTCEACAERFCTHCLVTFQGKLLCGPCKNAQIKALDEPAKLSVLAVFAALLSVGFGLVGFCMPLLPATAAMDLLPVIIFFLLLQLGTLGMSALALYRTEKTSLLRGRSLALTGLVASCVGLLLTVVATVYSYVQWV